jgi:hypothetical protein
MAIGEMLETNCSFIRELRLSWNFISGKGGNSIAEGLRFNKQLRVLYIGWNSLG